MPYSRNPISGAMEAYTGNGYYTGIVSTMGDFINSQMAQDGGPGSGNFGHKGRPGKVGGSAPEGEGGAPGKKEIIEKLDKLIKENKANPNRGKATIAAGRALEVLKKINETPEDDPGYQELVKKYNELSNESQEGPEDKPVRIKIDPNSKPVEFKIEKPETVSAINERIDEIEKELNDLVEEQRPVLKEFWAINAELQPLHNEESEEYKSAKRRFDEVHNRNNEIEKKKSALISEQISLEKKRQEVEERDDTPESVGRLIMENRRKCMEAETEANHVNRKYEEKLRLVAALMHDGEVEEAKKLTEEAEALYNEKERLNNEAYLLRRQRNELEARQKRAELRQEKRELEESGFDEPEYRAMKAVGEFGTTDNFFVTGWILRDGQQLDFGDGNEEERQLDHREISRVYSGASYNGTREMRQFRNDGNVRFYPETPGINLSMENEPTEDQYEAIRRAIDTIGDEKGQFCVDFSSSDGDMYGQLAYAYDPEDTGVEHTQYLDADEVIRDIKEHYRTGEVTEEFGPASFMGDAMAKDGGPGSGNWGHAGRPGKVGGSQKGGGGQYRGGKAEVGYFGSRRDWLNGLSGEKQHGAARFIAKQKRAFQDALEAKKKVETLVERGLLTKSEGDDQIKTLGVNDLTEKSPVEMYILRRGSDYDKFELLKYADAARNWPDNHERLKNTNLTEEERKVDEYISKRWNDGPNRALSMMLHAKALGIPCPDIEIPEELLYESGAKERPKTKYGWYALRKKVYSSMENHMYEVCGRGYGFSQRNLNEEGFEKLNKEFIDTMRYGKLSPVKCRSAISAVAGMRTTMSVKKDERNGFYYTGEDLKITPEMVARLDDSEKERLLGLVNRINNNGFNPEEKYASLEDVDDAGFDAVEHGLKSMTLRTSAEQQIVRDYVLDMEKMLTGEIPSEDDPVEAANKAKKEAEAQKRRDFIAKRDEEQKAFAASGGVEKKRKAVEAISKVTPEQLHEMGRDATGSLVYDTGIMAADCEFVTSSSVPERAYHSAVLAYRDVIAKYPFLAGEFGGFGDRGDSIASCCKDAYRASSTEVMINYSKFTSESGLWNEHKTGMDRDWFVKVDEGLPMGYPDYMHELGHVLANWLHRYTIGEFHGVDYTSGWRTGHYYDNEVATSLKRKTLAACKISGYDAIKREVSEYAASSRTNKAANQSKSNTLADEFFAECFCELMCSSNPRPVAREFGKQLDKFIKENGITADSTAMTESTMPKFDKGT